MNDDILDVIAVLVGADRIAADTVETWRMVEVSDR